MAQEQLVLPLQEFQPEYARLAALERSLRDGQSFDGIVPNFLKQRVWPITISFTPIERPEPPVFLPCTELQPQPRRPKPNNRRRREKAARRAHLRNLRLKNR